ncbi:MAG: permease prefix domain 1-containing protein [Vicinamibacteria bacterium]
MSQETERSEARASLEEGIAEWRSYVRRRQAIHPADANELEDHLRSQARALVEAGLSEDEAFLIAVKRLGDLDTLSREFAREHSERLWKRLVVAPGPGEAGRGGGRDALLAVALAVGAAAAIKAPELFGVGLHPDQELPGFYFRSLSLFALPFLAAFFAFKRSLAPSGWAWLAAPFLVGAAAVHLAPFSSAGPAKAFGTTVAHTEVLAALHLPIALWLAVGFAYAAGRWRDHDHRMNFVRFSGEWFIYYALIALGGGVLMGLTAFVFSSIGVKPDWLVFTWMLPCGAVGAVVIAGWLVEAKQSVIENMAPVLTLLFTPLFTLLMLGFLGTMAWTGSGLDVRRELLIGFDLLLVLVVGLVVYAVSARDPLKGPGLFDALQLGLVASALLVDALALWAIAARISEFGMSPNKVAALGENLILLANLGGSAVLYGRFLSGRSGFAALERWQTAFLPVYAAWAWIVVVVFPPAFGFR